MILQDAKSASQIGLASRHKIETVLFNIDVL